MGKRLLIAGGGTGGHLFPAIAVAEEWLAADPTNQVHFIGSRTGLEAKVMPEAGYPFTPIRVLALAGRSFQDKVKAGLVLPTSLFQSWLVIRNFRPDLALGVGSFVSGPPLLAAWLLRLPTAIQEQNSVPGSTNLILSRLVDRVFVNLEMTRASFPEADRAGRVVVAGNPIRRVIREKIEAGPGPGHPSNHSRVGLLVVGGSQGARRLNYLVMDAMNYLKEFKDVIKIVHQTGSGDVMDVVSTYARMDFRARVQEFITDMASALVEADIIISRAGAGAVAEIALAGKPSILVPFPYAVGEHQTKNAQAMVEAGAALMFLEQGLTGKRLAEELRSLIENPALRKERGAKARALAKPDAAKTVVQGLNDLLASRRKT
jgi:UDP-N-acetylglucosamine--N-acetylmuramyl-(pentapeptide) pyrophosphoryl-undecaprenol N-acetylglucosamine transferase